MGNNIQFYNSLNISNQKLQFRGSTYNNEPKIKLQKPLEQDKVEFALTATNENLLNPATGNLIATNIKDLPELPENWVTLTHVTRANKEDIINNGLWYSNPYAIDETTCISDKKSIIEEVKNGERTHYGDTYFVFQMPADEYLAFYNGYKTMAHYKENLGYKCPINNENYGLVIPPYYIVGCLNREDIEKLSEEQADRIISKKGSLLDIKPTDSKLYLPEQKIEYITSEEYFSMSPFSKKETAEVKYLPEECKGLSEEEVEKLLPELKSNFLEKRIQQNKNTIQTPSTLGSTEDVIDVDEDW